MAAAPVEGHRRRLDRLFSQGSPFMMQRTAIVAGVLWAIVSAAAVAHELKRGDLLIDHPWARATIGNVQNGAAYMTITTDGQETDRLVGVEGDVADRVELHSHTMEEGVMKMRPVEAVEIAPGRPTVLQPGGLHVMLIGLRAPLVEGEYFPLTLVFERAGAIEVEVEVESATHTGAPAGTGHDPGS
jgi:copper(I)-binding protein